MSQRAAKVESLIQSVTAKALFELLEGDAAVVTVTRVDVAPDLRNATIWIGLLGEPAQQEKVWKRIEYVRPDIQRAVGGAMTTKFIPRLLVKRDTGGAYAAEIDRLLRGL
jgi:ribosome-binding factor A